MKQAIKVLALLLAALPLNAIAQEETADASEQVATDTAQTASAPPQTKTAAKEKIDTAELMKKRYGIRAGVNWSSLGWSSVTGFQIGGSDLGGGASE